MPLEKLTNLTKTKKWLLIVLFIVVFLLTRLPRIATDEANPDGVNWHYRSQQFVNGLKYFQFEKTYQHYHPGVTLMWITGIPIELVKQISGQNLYTAANFAMFNAAAKIPLVLVQLILSVVALLLLAKFMEFKKALFIISMFTFEPFFLGNSRLYHMDILLTLFLFISLLLAYFAVTKKSMVFAVLSGISLALSFLTKSIGIGGLVYISMFILFFNFINKDFKYGLKMFGVVLGSFVLAIFLLFPALWVKPFYYLGEIFSESERVGVRKGHEQIVFGEVTTDAGAIFYPLVIVIKSSPFLLIGLLMGLLNFKQLKSAINIKKPSLALFLAVFYLGYFLVMTLPTKKLDRYMLVMYPFLGYMAVTGFEFLAKFVKKYKNHAVKFFCGISVLVILFWLAPLINLFPYYFTYTNPLVGSSVNANNLVAQKPFGIGIFDLRDSVIKKYGTTVKMGFLDVKPMEAVYSASRVFDIREEGPSKFDIIILGINESLSEKVLESPIKFKKDFSMYINGLEYWRVYVKETN